MMMALTNDEDPLSLLRLYSYRFRIECKFRALKQQVSTFCYHFWSNHIPKLSYDQKKGDPSPMERVEDEKFQKKIPEAVCATEMHIALSCIAMGILQSIFICFAEQISPSQTRYQRTTSKNRGLEAADMH